MSEPHDPRRDDYGRAPDERLTTAALAGAGGTNTAGESRSFTAGERRSADGLDAASESPMFPADEADELRRTWDAIQTGFVDEPRRAVEDADALVARAMQRLAESFARERDALERQWDQGDDVSTEDLRQALQRYRAFFGRLLST